MFLKIIDELSKGKMSFGFGFAELMRQGILVMFYIARIWGPRVSQAVGQVGAEVRQGMLMQKSQQQICHLSEDCAFHSWRLSHAALELCSSQSSFYLSCLLIAVQAAHDTLHWLFNIFHFQRGFHSQKCPPSSIRPIKEDFAETSYFIAMLTAVRRWSSLILKEITVWIRKSLKPHN